MAEDNFNASNPETANHHWFPFLRYKKECEAAGKEVSVNEWMREVGKLDEKIAHEESVALAAKIAAEKEADAKKAIEKEAEEKKAAIKKDADKTKKSLKEKDLRTK
tara:strand:+ start:8292 stop:8609 length:318 start_codon:yes stop_codon:yes gene_type:complete